MLGLVISHRNHVLWFAEQCRQASATTIYPAGMLWMPSLRGDVQATPGNCVSFLRVGYVTVTEKLEDLRGRVAFGRKAKATRYCRELNSIASH